MSYLPLSPLPHSTPDAEFRETFGERRWAKPVPCVLIATKCDILDEKTCRFYGDVMQFVAKYNLVLIKVSNRTGLGIGKAFKAVMNQIVVSKETLLASSVNMNQVLKKTQPPSLVMDRE